MQDQREHHFMDLLQCPLGTKSKYILQGVFCIKIRGLDRAARAQHTQKTRINEKRCISVKVGGSHPHALQQGVGSGAPRNASFPCLQAPMCPLVFSSVVFN